MIQNSSDSPASGPAREDGAPPAGAAKRPYGAPRLSVLGERPPSVDFAERFRRELEQTAEVRELTPGERRALDVCRRLLAGTAEGDGAGAP